MIQLVLKKMLSPLMMTKQTILFLIISLLVLPILSAIQDVALMFARVLNMMVNLKEENTKNCLWLRKMPPEESVDVETIVIMNMQTLVAQNSWWESLFYLSLDVLDRISTTEESCLKKQSRKMMEEDNMSKELSEVDLISILILPLTRSNTLTM